MQHTINCNSMYLTSSDKYKLEFDKRHDIYQSYGIRKDKLEAFVKDLNLRATGLDFNYKEKKFVPDEYVGSRLFVEADMASNKKEYNVNIYSDFDNADRLTEIYIKYGSTLKERKKERVYMIRSSNQGYDLQSANLGPKKKHMMDNYPDTFHPFHDHIVKKLKSNDSGVVLLHGSPGTGKTSYIKYLTSIVNRKFVIVPNNLVDQLSTPNMISFLMANPEMILILEDAEDAVSSRDAGRPNSVASLLNLSDGLIGSAIKCTLIVTFNTELRNIDQALLRKGRLIGEYKFCPLPIPESNKLLAKLNKNHVTDKPMLLTDIFNFDEEVFKAEKTRETIGFRKSY